MVNMSYAISDAAIAISRLLSTCFCGINALNDMHTDVFCLLLLSLACSLSPDFFRMLLTGTRCLLLAGTLIGCCLEYVLILNAGFVRWNLTLRSVATAGPAAAVIANGNAIGEGGESSSAIANVVCLLLIAVLGLLLFCFLPLSCPLASDLLR